MKEWTQRKEHDPGSAPAPTGPAHAGRRLSWKAEETMRRNDMTDGILE